MSFPEPAPGLVIRYNYLWYSEHLQGREEGRKDRPCAIIAAIRSDHTKAIRVLVLPITHVPPADPDLAIDIPVRVKQRLKLDDAPSWIVLSEWNEFVWPGFDLRPLPGVGLPSIAYGLLPPSLFAKIRGRFLALADARLARPVLRTE